MRGFLIFYLLTLSVAAVPIANPLAGLDAVEIADDNKPKGAAQPKTSGGHQGGGGKIVLIFARGTTETGTMGITVGPALSNALKKEFGGRFTAEGVSYPAGTSHSQNKGLRG
jgi:cutinase